MVQIILAALISFQSGESLRDIPGNLLIDPGAEAGGSAWRSYRDASVEVIDGNAVFVVRNGGQFQQAVSIPIAPGGTFAVFLARASSERIDAFTGLAYLYGLMLSGERGRISAHLQGQGMRSRAKTPHEWTTLYGIFDVPPGTIEIVFQLSQAERRGVPQNGSAARFDDTALVLVPTKAAAEALVAKYR